MSLFWYILGTYRYIHVCIVSYKYILQQVTLTLHLQWRSGTITLATLTSVLPALVRCVPGSFLPIKSLHDCQATQARLATPKLPQPRVNLIDIAAAPSIRSQCLHNPTGNLNSCSCCTCEGLSESRCQPESRASGGFCPPCFQQVPRRDMVLGMVHKT